MTEFITTERGDRVAFDRRGSGPGLLFIAGAGPYRAIDPVTTETAELLAAQGVTTIVYDRLGRGESLVEGCIDLARELAAVSALVEAAGGSAVLCGHSSGCAIALKAATQGLAVNALALWEAPIGPEDGGAHEWAAEVDRRITSGDLEGALLHFMKDMPAEFLEGVRQAPFFPEMARRVGSHRPDGESLAWAESAPLAELLSEIVVPVVVMTGESTYPVMLEAADRLVAAVPGATHQVMPGAQHSWQPEPMAAALAQLVEARVQAG